MPLGRREHRKRATRGQLLLAGRRLFGQQGLYESRIEDMTKIAGVAKGTLYGYFPSKESLLAAVVQAAFADLSKSVLPEVRAARGPVLRVQAAVLAHFRFYEGEPDLLRILHQVRGLLKFDRPEGRPLRAHLEHYIGELAIAIAPREPGDSRVISVARLTFGAASGAASTYASLGEPMPGADLSKALGRGLAMGLTKRAGSGRA